MTKNEEAFLPACLESVRGLADEIIVVDTDSSDRTVEIARQFGAKIHAYRWNDDFAEARNESLRHATKDWLLVLDADHTVDPSGHDEIRRIVQRDEFAGYMLRQFNYTDEHGTESVLEHLNLRLFPNHPAVGYAGRIHEQVICRNADLSFKVHACGAILHHHGLRPQVFKQRGKAERDRRVLLEMAREDPENAFHAHNLGMTHAALGEYAEAERALRRAIELSMPQLQGGPYPLYLVSTHLILARALLAQGRNAEAVQCCAAAVRLAPNFADAQLLLGTAELRLGHLDEALRSYERARRCSDGWRFGPSDHSASGWRALLGMGEVYLVQRQWRQAAAHLEQAVARSAKARALFPALARVCVEIVGAAEAEQGLGELLDATGAAAARLLLAEVFLADGAAEQALEQLTEALRDDEQNPEILSRMAEAFQRLGCAGEAEAARQASQLPRMDRATPGPAQPTGRATPAR